MDDFTVLTEEEKNQAAYFACAGGMTLTGIAVGRFGGLPGLLLGGGVELAIGIKACKSPMLLEPIRQVRPGISKDDAMALLAHVRANSRTGENSCQT